MEQYKVINGALIMTKELADKVKFPRIWRVKDDISRRTFKILPKEFHDWWGLFMTEKEINEWIEEIRSVHPEPSKLETPILKRFLQV